MVKHLVMWRLQDGFEKKERAAALEAEANRLLAVIDGVGRLEVWEGYQAKEVDHQLGLYIEFDCRESETAYQSHPNHLLFKEFIQGFTKDRVAIDTER